MTEPLPSKYYPRPCGCKGIRRCLLCEVDLKTDGTDGSEEGNPRETEFCSFVFCTHCSVAFYAVVEDYDEEDCSWHQKLGNVPSMPFPGVSIYTEFITVEHEKQLEVEIEARPWAKSQSGRLKQDYGPKCNFKKRKLKLETFTGFPAYLEPIVAKFSAYPSLAEYHTVEQCNLDYEPTRGSAIDPHFDDFWVWGERLLTLSLLSLTFLTLSLPEEDAGPKIYDDDKIELAKNRRREAEERWRGLVTSQEDGDVSSKAAIIPASTPSSAVRVHLPMPPRSLMLLEGPCRDTWVHEVLRHHVKRRRIAIAFRELAEEFLPGGKSEELGEQVLERARRFDGVSRIEC